ncbi:hypothetical protein K2173_021164 [Erythroxylum novogranatense]|uniref:BHLH domain-containing protein n=1 Tax=Erythroxylum novogranatense TaxID=1862640 RepID=A0AAV8TQQ0_9ROSI|nr:hypothetical protein K2173_021164 [Erythroxylum novogranatense]
MSNLLRDLLRTFCGVNQWCYSVFWKFGCQNPKLLIWEECYYEPTSSSIPPVNCGNENSGLHFTEQGYWSSDTHFPNPCFQAKDAVHVLINKMMLNYQVNVVGEGIVGRAAFTGKHYWILANKDIGNVHPPEVLNELHHQFSAGMQTVAVIPVFPHGVVQLGSLLAITENMGFVNYVKSLILQLGCIPGALLPANHSTKESVERVGVPISHGLSASMHLMNSTPLWPEGSSHQSISVQASNFVVQPCHSQSIQSLDIARSTMLPYDMPCTTNLLPKSHEGHSEVKSRLSMRSGGTFKGSLENIVDAELIPSNSDAWLNRHDTSNNLVAGFSYQPANNKSVPANIIPKSLQRQISSDAVNNHIGNNRVASQSLSLPQTRTNERPLCNPLEGSVISSGDLLNKDGGHMQLSSVPYTHLNPEKLIASYLHEIGPQNVNSSKAEEFLSSTPVAQVSCSQMNSDGSLYNNLCSGFKRMKDELIDVKVKPDNDLFQAFRIPSTHLDECMSLAEHISDTDLDCLNYATGNQNALNADAAYEGSTVHCPSGDDLYDILGVDFKTKLLNGNWKSSFSDGLNAQNMSKDTSTSINMQEASSDIFTVNEPAGNNIFTATDTDHLLDVVVSRAQSAANQSSDDNVSCRTTMTKMSSSSIPSDSCTYGRVDMPNQLKGESFDLLKTLEKAGTTVSSSLRSGYVNDDKGTSSHSTSIYGSQLSSWVEQAHNMRRDSSVSTAFSKKSEEMSKPNRKRLKPGENSRPRPKDRQMIQDRVKELREIVPNGAKCSIDALLERTIKHMLFLQSVSKHADKLKPTGESKIISKEGGVLLKDNFEGGATWAFEVGSQSMVCPIVVEDLNPPRQMLVEMLCEESGFFLEIADLIRGLGLTILRGVMEAQNDKIWARFAVEANRDITRMEIFMSLVRLLEQTVKGNTPSTNALETNPLMGNHAFSQASSIPATGRPSSLQ